MQLCYQDWDGHSETVDPDCLPPRSFQKILGAELDHSRRHTSCQCRADRLPSQTGESSSGSKNLLQTKYRRPPVVLRHCLPKWHPEFLIQPEPYIAWSLHASHGVE